MTKTVFTSFVILLLFTVAVSAAEVCVVVDFADAEDSSSENKFSDCLDVNSGETALAVLQRTALTLETKDFGSSLGQAICSINGVGDSSTNCFSSGVWSFFIANGGDFRLSSDGISSYRVKDDDVLGFLCFNNRHSENR